VTEKEKSQKPEKPGGTDPDLKLVRSTELPLLHNPGFEKLWTVQRRGIYIACTGRIRGHPVGIVAHQVSFIRGGLLW
jgi:hypothetical protein